MGGSWFLPRRAVAVGSLSGGVLKRDGFVKAERKSSTQGGFQCVYFRRPQFLRSALLFPPATLNTA